MVDTGLFYHARHSRSRQVFPLFKWDMNSTVRFLGYSPDKADGSARFQRGSPPAGGGNVAPARRGRARGGLNPLLSITPAGRRSRVPATANKFFHILWKNLFAITSRRFGFPPDPGGGSAGDVWLMPAVRVKATLRPGAGAPLWGGSQSPACRNGNWVADGRRHLLLRTQRVLKEEG